MTYEDFLAELISLANGGRRGEGHDICGEIAHACYQGGDEDEVG